MSSNESAYDEWSLTYDTDLNSTVATDDLAFPPCWKHLRGRRVLEIGCGTGRHTQRLLDQGNAVVGVDLSQGMLKVAEKRLRGRPVRLVHGDLLGMDLQALSADGPFQAALSALVLEHIGDLRAFFRRVGSLLEPGSPFYISEIHPCRAKRGRLAHFTRRETGEEVWLESQAYREAEIHEAAIAEGFEKVQDQDALGGPELLEKNPSWVKYQGVPMVKIFEFRWEGDLKP